MSFNNSIASCLFRATLLVALSLYTFGVQAHSSSSKGKRVIELTGKDRATIIQSVLRLVFNDKSNTEGTHLILANGMRPEWMPKIPKFNLILSTRREIERLKEPSYYYVIQLNQLKGTVRVTVDLYCSGKDEIYPEVDLNYSYYKRLGKWWGRFLYGGGN